MRKVRHRSSQTGRQVTKEFADANPDTTETETVKSRHPKTLKQAAKDMDWIVKHFKVVTDGVEAGNGQRFIQTGAVIDVDNDRILATFDGE